MHVPPAFREDDADTILDFIDAHPLGAMVTAEGGLFATHLPFVLDRPGFLRGHIARANPHARLMDGGGEALVIFAGPQAYISPGWYPAKARHGRVVPTWNYAAVHVYGTARAVDDPAFLIRNLEDLTARHEAGRPRPWTLSDAPDGFIDALLAAIVGVEIAIGRLEGKWKMSQNRPVDDVEGVLRGLRAEKDAGAHEVAQVVADRNAARLGGAGA